MAVMRKASTLSLAAIVCSCVSTPVERVWVDPQTTTATFDASGRPTDPSRRAASIWDPPSDADVAAVESSLQDPATQDPDEKAARRRQREAMIRATFGDAVTIADDGRLTKMFPVTGQTGRVFAQLCRPWDPADDRKLDEAAGGNAQFGGPRNATVLDRMLGADHEVDIVYLANFVGVQNMSVPLNANQIAAPQGNPDKGALVIVTAMPAALAAFERALDLFYTNIPQIEIEVKVVEYTTSDTLSFGIDPPGPAGAPTPSVTNQSTGKLIDTITADFPINAPFIGTSSLSDVGLIHLGGIHDSWELDATLQVLETSAIADIISQPKLVVANGGLATVQTTTALPFPKARISQIGGSTTESSVEFKNTGITMTIRPEVAGTDTVTLLVHANVSVATSFAATEPIPTPIISSRAATTSVHLREGETMVIGGLVSEQISESESKIPLLGDVPILGYLFRSTSTQKSKTVLEFHITPTIIRTSAG